MAKKQTYGRGKPVPKEVLSAIEAELRKRERPQTAIAEQFGVSKQVVIRAWKRLKLGQYLVIDPQTTAIVLALRAGETQQAIAERHGGVRSMVGRVWALEQAGAFDENGHRRLGSGARGKKGMRRNAAASSAESTQLSMPLPDAPVPSRAASSRSMPSASAPSGVVERSRGNGHGRDDEEVEMLRASLKKALSERQTLRGMVEILQEENEMLRERG